jgi:MFS transporter, DHA1 family, multidrug resistance protein
LPPAPQRVTRVLSAVSFTVALGYGIVAPAIPEFAKQFGVSVAAAASVISAFALMRVVGALPAGRLVDRFGEPPVMAIGIGIVAVSSILAGFSRSFAELLVLRGVGGLGSAMYTVSAQALLLASVPSEQRGRASGIYSGSFLIGGIGGPAVGGLISAWSLRAPFFIYGVLLLVPGGIAAFSLRKVSVRRKPSDAVTPVARAAALRLALGNRAYLAAAGANLAQGFAILGIRAAIIPLFVHAVLDKSAIWTGAGFGIFTALNGAALLPAGRLADTLGRRPVIVAGCLISAGGLALLAVPALDGPTAFMVALAIAGFGSGLLDVAPSAMLGDVLDKPQDTQGGTLVAGYQMAGDTGTVTGPVAAGVLVDSASYPAAFAVAAGVLGVAAALALAAPETRGRAPAAADTQVKVS